MYRGSLWPDVFNDANGVRLVSKSEGKQSIWANWKTQLQYIVTRDKEQSWRLYHSHFFFFLKGPESSSSASICSRQLCLWLVLMAEPVLLASSYATSKGLSGNERFLTLWLFIKICFSEDSFRLYDPLASPLSYWTCQYFNLCEIRLCQNSISSALISTDSSAWAIP